MEGSSSVPVKSHALGGALSPYDPPVLVGGDWWWSLVPSGGDLLPARGVWRGVMELKWGFRGFVDGMEVGV